MNNELHFIESFLRSQSDFVKNGHKEKQSVQVSTKRDAIDMLTEVDLAVQERAIEAIHAAFPGDWIVAEEGKYSKYPEPRDARAWVIDPIDGTNNFVRGLFPCFAISIALVEKGIPQAAGVLIPGTGDMFLAIRGQGASCNMRRLAVSDIDDISAARLELDCSHRGDRDALLRTMPELFRQIGEVRCHGSSVVSNCQIATGDIDAFLHVSLNPWDYAAVWLFVEEAGGKATRLDNSAIHIFDGKPGILISNGHLHEKILALLVD
jgi:myo-inositol-1(or 4)-monophosphatase